MKEYSLGELVNIFEKDAESWHIRYLVESEKFKENNPMAKLPDYLNDSFNLPSALALICKEIIKIKVGI